MTFTDARPRGVEMMGLETRESLSVREGRDLSHAVPQPLPLTEAATPAQGRGGSGPP